MIKDSVVWFGVESCVFLCKGLKKKYLGNNLFFYYFFKGVCEGIDFSGDLGLVWLEFGLFIN